jgi:hypothetical protein
VRINTLLAAIHCARQYIVHCNTLLKSSLGRPHCRQTFRSPGCDQSPNRQSQDTK